MQQRIHLVRFLTVVGILTCSVGCVSYPANPSMNMKTEESVSTAASFIGLCDRIWWGAYGYAHTNEFAHIRQLPYPKQDRGVLCSHSYTDIEKVSVRVDTVNLLLRFVFSLGLIDPTMEAGIKLRFKDGSSELLIPHRRPETIWDWTPFWMFRPAWVETHKAAQSFEHLRTKPKILQSPLVEPKSDEPKAANVMVQNPVQTPKEPKIDGPKLEEQFVKEGIGSRFSVKVTSAELQEVLVSKDDAKAYFNTSHAFMDPVVLKESQEPGKYEIKAMVAGIDQSGKPALYNLPFGDGTVYMMYGRVKLFGCVFASSTPEPLIFLVHRPNTDGTYLQFVHVGGNGTVVTKEGSEVSLKQ